MKNIQNFTLFLLLASFLGTGCGYKYYLETGKEDYDNLQYAEARDKFNTSLKKKPESYEGLKMLSYTLEKLKDYSGAEKAYELALNYPQATLEDKLHYANMLMASDKHDQAETIFVEYLKAHPDDEVVKAKLESCQFIELFVEDTAKYKIKPLPLQNSVSMYSPVLYDGGVVFTAERLIKGQTNPWTGNSYNDMYFMQQEGDDWSEQKPIAPIFNKKYNDGPISFSNEGQYAVFTRSYTSAEGQKREKNEENFNNLFLYETTRTGQDWGQLRALQFNSEDYNCMHPALTPNGDSLFFASDMPGGQGGYDLYLSTLKGETWTKPINLGSVINTSADEVFPTWDDEGALYFSSDGHPSLGALDIFKSSMDGDTWRRPRNMNYPINSTSDDMSLIYLDSDSIGYFASNRKGLDRIYEVQNQPEGIVFIDGMVRDEDGEPMAGATVKLLDAKTGQVLAELVTDEDGKFDFELEAGKVYRIESSKDGYFTESFERSTIDQYADETVKVDFGMKKLVVTDPNSNYDPKGAGVYEIKNIYYDFDRYNIRADAASELDRLSEIMKNNPSISIELQSHTDSRGEDDYNLDLSKRRAKSAKAYLVAKGINVARIDTKGFGETKIINKCVNGVECSEEEAEENRRTEFIVTKSGQ